MKPSKPLLQSFDPIVDHRSKILVLGSMPGQASLNQQQYYGHKHNLFWQMPANQLSIDVPQDYLARLEMLSYFRVALWDVLKHCERQGSLDSSIVRETEMANDIVGLLQKYRAITKICFNGQKAYQSFKRHTLKHHADFFDTYEIVTLPSTSPANASIPKAVKFEAWQREVWVAANISTPDYH